MMTVQLTGKGMMLAAHMYEYNFRTATHGHILARNQIHTMRYSELCVVAFNDHMIAVLTH